MGIQGLLPLLKSIMVPIHIKDLEGCTVAVDTYSWLHKGALSCSRELCKGLPTSRHIQYCMHRVNLLRHHGVKPILVFDGGPLPMKLEQENKRARSRKENLARALEHEANGNSSAAYECYSKAVDISPSIAHELIQVLRQENVDYVVAPYEADAQMTFLAITKQVDAIITEDSDLIPFGCPRIIFKMDKFGHGVEFQASKLPINKELSLSAFSSQMLLEMCILSGCDYLQSLPGMGLKRAHSLITKFRSYDRVIKHLKYSTVSVPPLYEESFKKALLTFKHQRVYDPKSEAIIHLTDISEEDLGEDSDFVGPSMPQHIAKGIALGQLDPFTQLPFQAESVTPKLAADDDSRLKSFKPETLKKKLDLPVQKNLLTKYFCFASVEAKRKFKAPRISPMSLTPTDESPTTPEANTTDVDASSSQTTNECPVYSLGEENACVSKVAEERESPDDEVVERNLKDLDHKYVEQQVRRPKTDSVNVVVRSKYFKQKHVDKSLKQLLPCLNDCSVVDQRINNSSASIREEKHRHIATSPGFHHERIYNNHEDAKEASSTDMNEGAERTTNIHKINHQIDKEDQNTSVEILPAFGTPKNVMPLSSVPSNSFPGAATGKRKLNSDENPEKENLNSKHMRMDETDPAVNAETSFETDNVKKFGSNISHIGHYSEIAEKSVERFVSAISSFKYSGPGSRASGLRAPLKDIGNTFPSNGKRSSPKLDFNKFGYSSSNQKSATKTRRFVSSDL